MENVVISDRTACIIKAKSQLEEVVLTLAQLGELEEGEEENKEAFMEEVERSMRPMQDFLREQLISSVVYNFAEYNMVV